MTLPEEYEQRLAVLRQLLDAKLVTTTDTLHEQVRAFGEAKIAEITASVTKRLEELDETYTQQRANITKMRSDNMPAFLVDAYETSVEDTHASSQQSLQRLLDASIENIRASLTSL